MLKRALMVAAMAILVFGIGVGVLGQVDPFSSLPSSVATVETWVFKVTDGSSGSVESWSGHEVVNYDGFGRAVETVSYTEDEGIDVRYVRSYDETGKLLQVESYGPDGGLLSSSCYTYEDGVRVEATYGASGDLQQTIRYELDDDGHIVRTIREGEGTDEGDSSWESTYTPDGEPNGLRMYDDQGDLTFAIDFNYGADGYDVVSTFTLYVLGTEFMSVETGVEIAARDDHGNWTEMRSYEHKEVSGEMTWVLNQITRREITYRE